jgi:protein-disulfide isomerase
MASGKKSRQQRRRGAGAVAVPPPPVRARGTRGVPRQASPRVLAAAAGVVVLAVVAIVLAVVLSGGKKSSVGTLPTNGSLANGLPGATGVNALFKGVPQQGLTLGKASAPVTLVEYIDLQCPYCRQFETGVMPDVVKRYVRTGKVKVEARVLAFIGPDSTRGRDAAIAAGQQGKAFNLAELLYDNQGTENTGWLNDEMVAAAAKSIPGLNPRRLFAERNGAGVKTQASKFDQEAKTAGVSGTPTLLVGRGAAGAKRVSLTSPTDEHTLVQAIQAALS